MFGIVQVTFLFYSCEYPSEQIAVLFTCGFHSDGKYLISRQKNSLL